jgi:hypothetical protein
MLHQLITPHDALQDGVLLLVIIVVLVNSLVLGNHLRDHKRWREEDLGLRDQRGSAEKTVH